MPAVIMSLLTRSHKFGERDYSDEAPSGEMLPKFFAKAGYEGTDPKKVKKEGGGKGNWGRPTAILEDVKYNPVRPRRRSNSLSFNSARDFKSKFEEVEPEPVFEDHMAEVLEEEPAHITTMPHDAPANVGHGEGGVQDMLRRDEERLDGELKLEHQSTTSSEMNGSVDGDGM